MRSAQEGDVPTWIELLRALDASDPPFGTDPDERDMDPGRKVEAVRDHLARPDDLLLLAVRDGRAVGYLDFTAYRRRRRAHVGWFHMGVDPAVNRQGVGSALLGTLIAWARENPRIEKVALAAFATNEAGLALYRKFGFREEGRRAREFRLGPDRYVDDVEMALRVK